MKPTAITRAEGLREARRRLVETCHRRRKLYGQADEIAWRVSLQIGLVGWLIALEEARAELADEAHA